MKEPGIVEVTLEAGSVLAHYQQIYTGFAMLARQGSIRLGITRGSSGVTAVVDGRRLFFDVQDGSGIDAAQLAASDAYYKRSYRPAVVEALTDAHKVHPLGLNYEVLPDFIDPRGLRRALRIPAPFSARLGHGLRALGIGRGFFPRVNRIEAAATPLQSPRVLFLTRAWEPAGDLSQRRPREALNDTRAACIRAIRSAFGDRALAGFAASKFACDRYPDLVVPPPLTAKRNYLRTLKRYPICVATTGLHGSVGWKVGEYVAFARAIVSEPLLNLAPEFTEGRHYLSFRDPAECVERISTLFDDQALRRRLMEHNADYYQQWLRPDRLVWHALTRRADSRVALAPVALA